MFQIGDIKKEVLVEFTLPVLDIFIKRCIGIIMWVFQTMFHYYNISNMILCAVQ